MDKVVFRKNGQWFLEKAYHRPQEEQDKAEEGQMFAHATMVKPHKVGSKMEIEHHKITNPVTTDLGEKMYHHVFTNQLGDTRHILSRHKDPNEAGVAGSMVQTDGFYTGFKDGRPVSAGIKTHVTGKGYGKALLEAVINHHGEWHSGESLSPAGKALLDSVAATDKYHYTPDTPESKEFYEKAMQERRLGDITRRVFKVKTPTNKA